MEKLFFIFFVFLLSHNLLAISDQLKQSSRVCVKDFTVSFDIIDIHSSNVKHVILEILELQSMLLVDNQSTNDLPIQCKEKGFLTIRMQSDFLMEKLQNEGRIIIARFQGQLVGYLLLWKFIGIPWMHTDVRVDFKFHSNLEEMEQDFFEHHIHKIDQIAVAHEFAKKGIGRQLVDIAKQLSPQGLSTGILYQPFTNEASLAFFSKQNFIHIATGYIKGDPPKSLMHVVYIKLWRP